MMLDDIVSRGRGGPPGQFHDNANGQNGTVQEIMIPAGKAGLVIGKGGETIKQLQVRGRPSELMFVMLNTSAVLVSLVSWKQGYFCLVHG